MADFTKLNGYTVKDPQAVHTYDTVADLKADTKLKAGNHAQTKGYTTVGDDGHATYIIVDDNTLVDDGGSVHELSNGLFAVLLNDVYVTPEMFGAYGDGTHDDTIAIHKAIEYSDKNFKCIKATKKYLITSSLDAENITNGYINIDGETPVHSYMQSGIYGYDIGGSFILNDVPLIAGNKTKVLRGSIRNITIIPVTKDSSTDVFYKVKFSGFHFNNLSVFYFKNFLDDCLCNASSRIENCVIQFIESLIYAESFIESAIQNNYITGISDRGSSCFNTYLYGTKVENNFIEYFDYIYNDQRDDRVTSEFISHGNTYDYFGTMFGLKTNNDPLTYVGLISTQDTFSNWRETNAILLPTTNMKVIIKSPIVKPASGNLSFIACSGNLYATDATFLWLDNIQSIVTYKPTINITFWSTNQQNRRIYIENLDYITVESLPSFGFIGQHVIYNDSLYTYIKSGTWKKISD